jgi:hypothetical protein
MEIAHKILLNTDPTQDDSLLGYTRTSLTVWSRHVPLHSLNQRLVHKYQQDFRTAQFHQLYKTEVNCSL